MGLDLAELDPQPVDLDLGVRATVELELAIRPPPDNIPGAVQPALAKWIPDESFFREIRSVEIASRDALAPDVELAFGARRQQLPPGIENIDLGVPQTLSNRRDPAVPGIDARPGRIHGRLRRSIEIDQPDLRRSREDSIRKRARERLAAEIDRPRSRRQAAACQQRLHQGRPGVDETHVARRRGGRNVQQGFDHDQSATEGQRQEQLVDRQVEIERRGKQHTLEILALHQGSCAQDQLDDIPVRDAHAFRAACRPRRINDVGKPVRPKCGARPIVGDVRPFVVGCGILLRAIDQ